jgi:L-ascorbate metabolism protein UlaG (beta-lactamase superfamily)
MRRIWIWALALFWACSGSIRDLPVNHGAGECQAGFQIQYLGAGGLLIRSREASLLTAPFFSNPPLRRVLWGRIRADQAQIDRALRPLQDSLGEVEAILVGHAHYDHLMDLPCLAAQYAPRARIYGSRTAAHILAAALDPERLVPVEDQAGTPQRPGQWQQVSGGRIRFMALESAHAPHLWGWKFFGGNYESDLRALPTRAGGWREGQTLAYLVDFLGEEGQVEFRLYYQDAASAPPAGFPPPFDQAADQHRVDVAVLCAAGFEQVEDYPEGIVQYLKPRALVLVHWENFFAPLPVDPRRLRTVPRLDLREFLRRLEQVLPPDARVELPAPGVWMCFDSRASP